ncbi:MAG: hypothetical protein MJZ28_12570 [Paludibacteraceae bacterium]|nr:hypothetical protein [Paludibacteraceae bacterium]
MKKIVTTIAASALASAVYAGGLNTNTNQHAAYQRNFAREATTDIDAAYTNPAGTVFMEDGLHLSFTGQCAFQERNIETEYKPFMMNGGDSIKKFNGEAIAPFVPSLQAVYKKNNWAAYFNFAVPGGGGKATFEDGIPALEKRVSSLPLALSQNGISTSQYSLNAYLKGQQMIFGATLGAAYKFNEHFSAAVGVRVCYASNSYEGYLKDIKINPDGQEMLANKYFSAAQQKYTDLAEKALAGAAQYEAAGMATEAAGLKAQAAQAQAAATQMAGYAASTKDIEIDCDQTGWGVAPIISLDYKMGPVNLATRYEFKTKISVENSSNLTANPTMPAELAPYIDGVESRDDLPALWTIGMDCNMTDNIKICTGYRYYFDKDAHFAGGVEKYVEHGTKEYAYGIEWNATKWLMVSGSYMRTEFAFADAYLNNINYNGSSNNFGLGGRFTLNEHLNIDLGGFFTKYEDRQVKHADYAGLGIGGVDNYERKNFAFALGINYHF